MFGGGLAVLVLVVGDCLKDFFFQVLARIVVEPEKAGSHDATFFPGRWRLI